MGNLGRYQEIVELAKRSGGVDAMIDMIKKGAVADAAPKLVGLGVAAGAALTVGVTKGYGRIKQALASRHEAIQEGDAAEQELRDVVEAEHRVGQGGQHIPEAGNDPSNTDQSDTTEDDDANRS